MKKQVLDILLKKFPAREYALMAEVRDAAGFNASRSADFLAVSLWPSRGLEVIGMERKSYRGDWLKELKTPEKAENIYQYCDRWYLLTDNENVAKLEEIPLTWGWLHIDVNGKLKVLKEAPKLEPANISRSFLAALLKRSSCKEGWVTQESISQRLEEAKESGIVTGENKSKRQLESYQQLVKDVRDFEEITGLKLNNLRWGQTGKELAEKVSFLLSGGSKELERTMGYIKNYHKGIGRTIEQYEAIFTTQTPS